MGSGNLQAYALGSTARSPHRAVGTLVAFHVRDEKPDGSTYVSLARLAKMTGKAERRVQDSVKHLEELGELTVMRRSGRTSLYGIVWSTLKWDDPDRDLDTKAGHLIADIVGIVLTNPGRRQPGSRAKNPGRLQPGSEPRTTDADSRGHGKWSPRFPDQSGTSGNQDHHGRLQPETPGR